MARRGSIRAFTLAPHPGGVYHRGGRQFLTGQLTLVRADDERIAEIADDRYVQEVAKGDAAAKFPVAYDEDGNPPASGAEETGDESADDDAGDSDGADGEPEE